MRILNKILIIFLILLGIFFMVYSFLKSTDNLDIIQNVIGDDVENQDEHQARMVKVYDGEIKFENLLDEFIENDLSEKISLTINEYENKERVNHKELIFTPGINNNKEGNDSENTTTVNTGNFDEFKESYGYYTWIVNGEVVYEKLYTMDYNLERKTEDGIVKVRLYDFVEKHEVELFTYTLESSNYTSKYDLKYEQRKDMGIKRIVDGEAFDVYEFGGDVSFILDDKTYTFNKAIEEGIITIDNILEQAKLDSKYGICEEGYYSDGGSVEYCYPDYTILKLSTLDGNNDMVIGFSGQIINKFNREFKKLNDNKLINESVKGIE